MRLINSYNKVQNIIGMGTETGERHVLILGSRILGRDTYPDIYPVISLKKKNYRNATLIFNTINKMRKVVA